MTSGGWLGQKSDSHGTEGEEQARSELGANYGRRRVGWLVIYIYIYRG
jgi:hypothetical protein